MLLCAKSFVFVPVIPMLESVNVPAPVFVSVDIWGELVVPIVCGPKVKFRGARETAGSACRKMRVCHVWQLLVGTGPTE